MNKQYKINYLSEKFYEKYNHINYPEIEYKRNRPYLVMLITIDDNTFAIPFRTNIRHNNCYKFQATSRNTATATGLDFTKSVIVNDSAYIGAEATIDDKEYVELNDRYMFIINKFRTYVNGYKKYVEGKTYPYQKNKYQYTSLQYFHDELKIARQI